MTGHAPVAVIAPAYPVLSETFVRREVNGLRALGYPVYAVGLRAGDADVPDADADYVVYGGGGRLLTACATELLRHPVRGFGTLAGAARDALFPGERTALKDRAKLLVQAVAGIGLAPWLRKRNVAHVHCHFAHASASVGMYAARQLGGTFSFVGHANDLFERRQLLRRKLQRASFVSCISRWHRDLYLDIEPDARSRLRVVRCGVDVGTWDAVEGGGETGPVRRLITVARLVEKKGIDTLISALARLAGPDAGGLRLVVVGGGPMADRLRRQASEEGVQDRIDWRGSQPVRVVRELLATSDAFVLPCRVSERGDMDGIPVALMEAMACMLPTVAGDLPAIRELVEHDVTGLLVPGGDVDAVVHALERLAGDPALCARIGRAGRGHVMEEFSAEVNLRRLEEAIREFAAAR